MSARAQATARSCPQCGSQKIRFEVSDAGQWDVCRDCGFRMTAFVQRRA